MGAYGKGQKVKAVRSIQRSSGAAWPDDEGEIVAVTGDGYRVRFTSGFVADNVKDHEVKQGITPGLPGHKAEPPAPGKEMGGSAWGSPPPVSHGTGDLALSAAATPVDASADKERGVRVG